MSCMGYCLPHAYALGMGKRDLRPTLLQGRAPPCSSYLTCNTQKGEAVSVAQCPCNPERTDAGGRRGSSLKEVRFSTWASLWWLWHATGPTPHTCHCCPVSSPSLTHWQCEDHLDQCSKALWIISAPQSSCRHNNKPHISCQDASCQG